MIQCAQESKLLKTTLWTPISCHLCDGCACPSRLETKHALNLVYIKSVIHNRMLLTLSTVFERRSGSLSIDADVGM